MILSIGLLLALLPWKQVAFGAAGAVVLWSGFYFLGPQNVWVPLAMLCGPIVIGGWLMGLFVRWACSGWRAA
ncbi:hypothetical protein GGR95_001273 [Sulfitobacter undariae]|uniref:Uncharacterized protein n=1 Tax=Sulfitobacter undariae TaxID=1563671 RepID=A0A7W6E6N7_9RHOB|nr:hypothetical protein [Sulfitobacter undariae]